VILQGILHTENESIQNYGQAVPNQRRRKGKKVESNIDLTPQNQTLKQQRQLNDRNHYIHINANNEC
jgi:hypothetical protein